MEGPGKYQTEAWILMGLCEARGVALVVLDGKKGYGFEVMAANVDKVIMAQVFRKVADEMERELEQIVGAE